MLKTTKDIFLRSPLAIATCEITGIHITLSIPAIPHKVFEYSNPLALYENAKDLALLGYSTHKDLGIDILAGTFLALAHHKHLLLDHLSATQRNILLQSCHPFYLSQACMLLARTGRKHTGKLPGFTLDSLTLETKNSSSLDVIKNYITALQLILDPPAVDHSATVYSTFTKGKVINHTNLTEDIKTVYKRQVSALYEGDHISVKFYNILREIGKANGLVALDKQIRDKIIAKLESIPEATGLIATLKTTEQNMTVEERIFKQKMIDGFEDTISVNMPTLGTKRSLKEILAEKKARSQTTEAIHESQQEEQEEEDNNDL